jgi:hypothetical protein
MCGRHNPGDRTGFRIFTDTLQMLCGLGDDTWDGGAHAFTKEKCWNLYDNVTDGGAGLGNHYQFSFSRLSRDGFKNTTREAHWNVPSS